MLKKDGYLLMRLAVEHFNSGKKQVHKIILGLNKVIYQ